MKKLLICGDSFAADWTIKYKGKGWVNLLADSYAVTNLAQAGCSEYKILKQVQSVDLTKFDMILVSHTSPYRLYVKEHPIHNKDILHKNSCLIYSDVNEYLPAHPELEPITHYLERYFDLEYAEHMHGLLIKEIESICPANTVHLSHIEWGDIYQCRNWINFKDIFKHHRGMINHYDDEGNRIIYTAVKHKLRELNE
jgi:hypothetical protein